MGLGVRNYLHGTGLGRTDRQRKGLVVWGYEGPEGQYRMQARQ